VIYAKTLGAALGDLMTDDPRVVLLGEDIVDPYGGAFKVTRGLSTAFPQRVRSTPISEGAIAGVSAGLALSGYRPIAEIMFGDFLALCFDQIVNHIAKYGPMYDGGASCPVIIRTPSGGGRAYGPTHSQSLEKHFMGVPNLKVVAASLQHDPRAVLGHLLEGNTPALHIEHKLLYPLDAATGDGILVAHPEPAGTGLPTVALRAVDREDCAATVVAYGYQAELARRVLERLAIQEEIFAELLIPAQISPMDWAPVEASASATGSLLTVEEGTIGHSWGTEVAAVMGRRLFGRLRRPIELLASASDVIPGSPAREAEVLVGERAIEAAIREAVR
jgi:acetoin:2,6-dichlorophenolindophenol oxidoreductase subunit beta